MMNTSLLLGIALGISAPALKDRPAKTPTLVGEWVAESCVVAGKASPAFERPRRWVFEPDGSRAIYDGDRPVVNGRYAFDPKADPPTLDLDPEGAAAGSEYLCIYKIEGDTLTLNVGWQGVARPPAFESTPGASCTLYVFRRVKKDGR